jgi:serine/threonine protein kinase/tetratricopeptide (TPR) repeat protein
MGEVYRAHDAQLDRDIAIKVLPDDSFSDPAARARLVREARAAAALSHPHICTIHEVGEADGHVYIAMELVTGQPLNQVIPAKGMPADQVLHYGLQIVAAAAQAHDRGIIHRDLKPANTLMTPEGQIKVLDFGLAKRTSRESVETTVTAEPLTQAGTLAGTLPYMAPEQLGGDAADRRSDVWALGVMLFEMATGARPFQGRTGFELSSAILSQPPMSLPENVPAALSAVIGRCLEKEPARRYQRAGELHAALDAIHSGRTTLRPQPTRRTRLVLTAVSMAVAAALGIGWWLANSPPSVALRIESLVVLPLDNLSGDPEQEYFVAGMHDALTGELGQISALRVISRTSAMSYKGTRKSAPEIARELNVDSLVEGSIYKDGQNVRVQVQLIRVAPTERQLWSQTYDGDLTNVLSLQKRVARAIADQIQVTLTPQEAARLTTARAVAPAAYDSWVRGLNEFHRLTPESLHKCLEFARGALVIDPSYGPAHALAASCYSILPNLSSIAPKEAFPKVKEAARRALDLDDSQADAHFALAWSLAVYDWDWIGAEREYRRGLELSPSASIGHGRFGWFLSWLGRHDEALAEVNRAMQLNPVGPNEIQESAVVHFVARRYDDAIVAARRATEIDPNYPFGWQRLGTALAEKGMYDQAIAAHEKAASLGAGNRGMLGRIYALGGRRTDARRVLEDLLNLRQRTYVGPLQIAMIYTGLGEKDEALRWFEEAFRVRDANLVLLKVFPIWDPLRSDPRFQDLLERLKFP